MSARLAGVEGLPGAHYAGIYQDALEAAENAIGYGENPRPAYYTIVDCLNYVALNEGSPG